MSIQEHQDDPNDIITLQFGRASNHVGSHYWNIQQECGDEMLTRPLYRGKSKPRALMCDFNKAVGSVKTGKMDSKEEAERVNKVYDKVEVYKRDNDINNGMYWTDYINIDLDDCCTHLLPGDYGMKRDGYYYAARDDLDWSETALRRLLESCDRLDTIQSLFDVSTSFTGDCVSAVEWLSDEVPKKDVIFVPLETFGKGTDATEWCLNFAYSICHCVASDSSSLNVLGCIPSGMEPLGSIIDNKELYKRTSPIALSLHALTYCNRMYNQQQSYKNINNNNLVDWGILPSRGDHQWEYHIDKVHLPKTFPRSYLGLSPEDQFVSVSTTLDSKGPNSTRQILRCLSELKHLRTSGNLDRCIANSNGTLESDTVVEFETILKNMTDQKKTASDDSEE